MIPLYDALEKTNYNDKELNRGCQGSGWGRMWLKRHSTKEVLGVMKQFCILIVMVIIEIYVCFKIHRTAKHTQPILLYATLKIKTKKKYFNEWA